VRLLPFWRLSAPHVSPGFTPNIQNLVQVCVLPHPPLLVFNTYKMLGAAMIPGNPQANMYFTLYGYNTLDQARGLIRDLKMVVIGRCHWLSSSLTCKNRANTQSFHRG
jgi:hypothetical protein